MDLYHILCMPLPLSDHCVADTLSDLPIPLIFHIQTSPISKRFFLSRILEIDSHLYISVHKVQVMSSFIMQLFYLLAR